MANYASLTYDQLWAIIFQNPLTGSEAEYVLGQVRAARDSFGFGKPDLDEPLDYAKVRDYVSSKRGTFNDKATIAKIYRDGLTGGSLPSMAADADKAVLDTTLPGGWVERLVRSLIDAMTDPATWKALSEINLTKLIDADLLDWDTSKKALLSFLSNPSGIVSKYLDLNAEAMAYLIQFLTGLGISGATIKGLLDGSVTLADKERIGAVIYSIITDNMLEGGVAEGYLKREPGNAETENLHRLFGAQVRLQIGSVALEAIEPIVPHRVAAFLRTLRDAVGDTINLDDAAEEIYQASIEKLVNQGLEAYYNRKIKPADLSATQALQARIAGKITDGDLGKILDNAGYRDDIRQFLRDLAATNLTESDINDLYQWNIFQRDEVKKQYKDKYYEDDDAELKTKLVEMTRRQKLREKIFELYGNLYRDGVATKQEVTPFLENYGYDADEVEMWFSVQELERRQRKWLPVGSVRTLSRIGTWTDQQATDYLVIQGMTQEDAATALSLTDALLSRGDIVKLAASGELAVADALQRMLLLGYGREDASLLLGNAILEEALRQIPGKVRTACKTENFEFTQLAAAIKVATELNPIQILNNSEFFVEATCIIKNHLEGK